LIFDGFRSHQDAQAFIHGVAVAWQLDAQLFNTAADAMAHDPFPWELAPPIVHVDRAEPEVERRIVELASKFGDDANAIMQRHDRRQTTWRRSRWSRSSNAP
jgi:hypothetical protein